MTLKYQVVQPSSKNVWLTYKQIISILCCELEWNRLSMCWIGRSECKLAVDFKIGAGFKWTKWLKKSVICPQRSIMLSIYWNIKFWVFDETFGHILLSRSWWTRNWGCSSSVMNWRSWATSWRRLAWTERNSYRKNTAAKTSEWDLWLRNDQSYLLSGFEFIASYMCKVL